MAGKGRGNAGRFGGRPKNGANRKGDTFTFSRVVALNLIHCQKGRFQEKLDMVAKHYGIDPGEREVLISRRFQALEDYEGRKAWRALEAKKKNFFKGFGGRAQGKVPEQNNYS